MRLAYSYGVRESLSQYEQVRDSFLRELGEPSEYDERDDSYLWTAKKGFNTISLFKTRSGEGYIMIKFKDKAIASSVGVPIKSLKNVYFKNSSFLVIIYTKDDVDIQVNW